MKIDLTFNEIRYLMQCMRHCNEERDDLNEEVYELLEENLKYEGGYKDEA